MVTGGALLHDRGRRSRSSKAARSEAAIVLVSDGPVTGARARAQERRSTLTLRSAAAALVRAEEHASGIVPASDREFPVTATALVKKQRAGRSPLEWSPAGRAVDEKTCGQDRTLAADGLATPAADVTRNRAGCRQHHGAR